VATLVQYTGMSERTVRTCLDLLEAEGIISPCDPYIVAARIKRADRRPQGWDLNLSLVRDDLDDAAVPVLDHQFPGLGIRLAAAAQPGADGQADGVQLAQLRGAAVAPEPSKERCIERPPLPRTWARLRPRMARRRADRGVPPKTATLQMADVCVACGIIAAGC
jgi:hypothetical protein